ncbi:hypothetical protein GCM10009539_45790 [Cryptosporangium japonicum]|uniref:Uncharacterized protein n=1 Tax=Cryptosporangium japonicum TaxID=80872 RepID=A0ABN0UMM8_9ACTN
MLAASMAALFVLVWFVAWVSRDEPDEVVRDYLEALSAGRTAEALEISRAEDVPSSPFLRPEAMDGGWTVDEVEAPDLVEGGIPDFENEDVYSVDYRLSGDRPGQFHLAEDGWSWRIENPLVYVQFTPIVYSFVQVGTVRAPLPDDGSPGFWMFPGVYRPYADLSFEALAPKQPQLVVAPRWDRYRYSPEFAATAAGNRIAQTAADTVVDDCVALRTAKCTMALEYQSDYDTGTDTVELEDVTAQRWRVVRRPVVGVRGSLREGDAYGPLETHVVTPGVLRLDATGLDRYDEPVTFSQTCEITKFRLTVRPNDAGALTFPRDGKPVHVKLDCTNAGA